MTNDSAHRDLTDWADLLVSAYAMFESGTARSDDFHPLPDGLNELSHEDAYRVQDLVLERVAATYGAAPSGYKIGGAAGLMNGALLDRMVLESGARVDVDANNVPLVEPEILLRTTAELAGEVSLADIARNAELGAGFELPIGRFRGWHPTAPTKLMTLGSMIADNALAGLLVVGGTWRPGLEPDELASVSAEIRMPDGQVATGRANPTVGTAYQTTQWLIGALAQRDRVLPAGSIIATGTLAPAKPATAGEYSAAFSHDLGEVRFTAV